MGLPSTMSLQPPLQATPSSLLSLPWAGGKQTYAAVPDGEFRFNVKTEDVWLKLTSTTPVFDGTVTRAHCNDPGCGRTAKRAKPGAIGEIPMSSRGIAFAGALHHGWDQVGFALSLAH